VSCNTYIKAMNAFCLWLHKEGHHADRLRLPLLTIKPEAQTVIRRSLLWLNWVQRTQTARALEVTFA